MVYRWFLTASPFELRIVYFNSQLVDFTSQTAMRSWINYALKVLCQPSFKEFGDGHLKSPHTLTLSIISKCDSPQEKDA